jgi:NADH dehydrogenase/NADH:ubiquinone oxidoreductase subunit G
MPYAFNARPWELTHVDTVDILDSMASSIRLDIINNKVVRVLPVLDEAVNEEWITNKARFSYDLSLFKDCFTLKLKFFLLLLSRVELMHLNIFLLYY